MADDATPVCSEFQRSRGGDWPWCAECKWRRDFHDNVPDEQPAESRGLSR